MRVEAVGRRELDQDGGIRAERAGAPAAQQNGVARGQINE